MKKDMNRPEKRRIRGRWLPLLIAVPLAALLTFAVIRYGVTLRNLIHVAIKAVVLA